MKKLFIIILIVGPTLGCKEEELKREQDWNNLQLLFSEIESLASSVVCEDSGDWTFTAYGNKACGGPVGYIAYSTKIDRKQFLNKVEAHASAQDAYNRKWGIYSDCSVPLEPKDITCEDGMPTFTY